MGRRYGRMALLTLAALGLGGCGWLPTPEQALTPPPVQGRSAVRSGGSLWRWTLDVHLAPLPPLLAEEGQRAVLTLNPPQGGTSDLVVVDETGRIRARIAGSEALQLTVDGDRLLTVTGGRHPALVVRDGEGRMRWSWRPSGTLVAATMAAASGTVYAAQTTAQGTYVLRLAHGQVAWKVKIPAEHVVAAPDGGGVLAQVAGGLVAISGDGHVLGKYAGKGPLQVAVADGARRVAVLDGAHQTLVLWDPRRGVLWETRSGGAEVAIAPDGRRVATWGPFRATLYGRGGRRVDRLVANRVEGVQFLGDRLAVLVNRTFLPNRRAYLAVVTLPGGAAVGQGTGSTPFRRAFLAPGGRFAVAEGEDDRPYALRLNRPLQGVAPGPPPPVWAWQSPEGTMTVASSPGGGYFLLVAGNNRLGAPPPGGSGPVYLMTPTGAIAWLLLRRDITASAVGGNGEVVLGTADGRLLAVNARGLTLWQRQWPQGHVQSVAVSADDRFAAAVIRQGGRYRLAVVAATSRLVCVQPLPSPPAGPPAVTEGPGAVVAVGMTGEGTRVRWWQAKGCRRLPDVVLPGTHSVQLAASGQDLVIAAGGSRVVVQRRDAAGRLLWQSSVPIPARVRDVAAPVRGGGVTVLLRMAVPGLLTAPPSALDEVWRLRRGRVLWRYRAVGLVQQMAVAPEGGDVLLLVVPDIRVHRAAAGGEKDPAPVSLLVLSSLGREIYQLQDRQGLLSAAFGPDPGLVAATDGMDRVMAFHTGIGVMP